MVDDTFDNNAQSQGGVQTRERVQTQSGTQAGAQSQGGAQPHGDGTSGRAGGAADNAAAGAGGDASGTAKSGEKAAQGDAARASSRGNSRKKRRRIYAMSRDERKAVRRSKVLKFILCIVLVALTFILAMLVGTDEYRPSPVGWVPFVAVVVAIVLAFIYIRILKASLKLYEKSDITDCRRDEKVRFSVRMVNKSPLFYFRAEAHFYTGDLYGNPVNHAVTTLALAPFEKYEMPFTTKFEHIGVYQAGLDRVVIYDFLRLFTATIDGPKRTRVNVTPRLVEIPTIGFSTESVVETTKSARSMLSDSMDYAAVREYVWGDPLKSVHWKLSAREQGMMTKLFETYTNPGVSIVLDFYGPGQDARELMNMFDTVVETGFSVARYAQSRGMDTEIHYVDKTGVRVHRTTWRQSDLPQIVSDMPRFSSHPDAAADALGLLSEQIRSIHGQNNIVICTANLSSQMIDMVASAKVQRRSPLLFAVVPRDLEGREREEWLAPLAHLDAMGITYVVISSSADLLKVKS